MQHNDECTKKSHSFRSGISLYVSDKVTNRAVPNGVSSIAGVGYALSAATRRLAKDRQQETGYAVFLPRYGFIMHNPPSCDGGLSF